jgi:hypothetical protein
MIKTTRIGARCQVTEMLLRVNPEKSSEILNIEIQRLEQQIHAKAIRDNLFIKRGSWTHDTRCDPITGSIVITVKCEAIQHE